MRLAITFIIVESLMIGFFIGAYYGSYTTAKKFNEAAKPTIIQEKGKARVLA